MHSHEIGDNARASVTSVPHSMKPITIIGEIQRDRVPESENRVEFPRIIALINCTLAVINQDNRCSNGRS